MTRIKRTRFFLAVEGEGEQSFIKWLQQLSDQISPNSHFDCQLLNGGGYKTMLDRTLRHRKRKERHKAKASIMLVDGDRTLRDDGWSLSRLREEASKHKIMVCIQNPNQEGLLLKLHQGNERTMPDSTSVLRLLRNIWPEYQKPVDARTLSQRFSIDDLTRLAAIDEDLRNLLIEIRLLR